VASSYISIDDRWGESTLEEGEQRGEEGRDSNSNSSGDSANAVSQSPWATESELQVLQQAPAIPWPGCLALFGRRSRLEKAEHVEEQKAI